jgi:hypothetical protein
MAEEHDLDDDDPGDSEGYPWDDGESDDRDEDDE